MAALSGKDGDVKVSGASIGEVTGWKFSPKVNVGKYASASTGGFKKAVPGTKDGSGSVSLKYTTDFSLDLGDAVTLTLKISAGKSLSVPAVVESFDYVVDLDNGDIVGIDMAFQADGEYTL